MNSLATLNKYQLQEFFPSIKWNKYIPHHPLYPKPNPRQYAFLAYNGREAFYGGQAGGGKSDGLLMGGLQYVDEPACHAILFRRTYADLNRSGGLIPRAKEWLAPYLARKEVKWNGGDKRFTFPSGATVEFGYLDNDDDIMRYQGGDWTFAGFDELPQLKLDWYRYIFSRMRKGADTRIPIRVRGTGNPGGPGHEWVKQRFILDPERVFIRAALEDNPYLDIAEYDASLRELDPITYRQLRFGDWDARPSGGFFSRDKLRLIPRADMNVRPIRMWDLAATKNQTSAYTAGGLFSWSGGKLQVRDVVRLRGDPGEVENVILQTAQRDGRGIKVYIEQELGSGGVNTLYRYRHYVLAGWSVEPYLPKHDKLTRAAPLSALAHGNGLEIVEGRWNAAYLDELVAFPDGFRDQVDVSSAAYQVLTQRTEVRLRSL